MRKTIEFDERLHKMLMDIKAEPDVDKKKLMIKDAIDYMKKTGTHLAYINELAD